MTKTNGSPSEARRLPASWQMPLTHPDLWPTTCARRKSGRDRVVDLLGAKDCEDLLAVGGTEQPRGAAQRLELPREVGGGDEVVDARFACGASSIPRATGSGGSDVGRGARRSAPSRPLSSTRLVARLLDARSPGSEPAQRDCAAESPPGLRVVVVGLVDAVARPVKHRSELVVDHHAPIEVETSGLRLAVRGHHECELHRAGGVVPNVGRVGRPRIAFQRATPR